MVIDKPVNSSKSKCFRCQRSIPWYIKAVGYFWEGEWIEQSGLKINAYYTCIRCSKTYCRKCWTKKGCFCV